MEKAGVSREFAPIGEICPKGFLSVSIRVHPWSPIPNGVPRHGLHRFTRIWSEVRDQPVTSFKFGLTRIGVFRSTSTRQAFALPTCHSFSYIDLTGWTGLENYPVNPVPLESQPTP